MRRTNHIHKQFCFKPPHVPSYRQNQSTELMNMNFVCMADATHPNSFRQKTMGAWIPLRPMLAYYFSGFGGSKYSISLLSLSRIPLNRPRGPRAAKKKKKKRRASSQVRWADLALLVPTPWGRFSDTPPLLRPVQKVEVSLVSRTKIVPRHSFTKFTHEV